MKVRTLPTGAVTVLVTLLLFSLTPPLGAQERAFKKIKVGLSAPSPANVIPWVAKEAGIFAKYGLDAELILLQGSGQASQALIGGSLFVAPVVTPTAINAVLGGADLVILAHTLPGVVSRLMVKPEIRTVADLKGKKIGAGRYGTLMDFLTRYILKKHGLQPDRDVALIQIDVGPELLQALIAGAVDGGALSHPAYSQAQQRGFHPLWDARQEISFPFMEVVTRRKAIREDRAGVMDYMKAHVEGIHAFKTQKELGFNVMAKYLKISDRKLLEESYDLYAPDFIPAPYPNTEEMKTSFEYVALTKPEVMKHKPEEFVDSSFVAELDKSGFIKKLYGR